MLYHYLQRFSRISPPVKTKLWFTFEPWRPPCRPGYSRRHLGSRADEYSDRVLRRTTFLQSSVGDGSNWKGPPSNCESQAGKECSGPSSCAFGQPEILSWPPKHIHYGAQPECKSEPKAESCGPQANTSAEKPADPKADCPPKSSSPPDCPSPAKAAAPPSSSKCETKAAAPLSSSKSETTTSSVPKPTPGMASSTGQEPRKAANRMDDPLRTVLSPEQIFDPGATKAQTKDLTGKSLPTIHGLSNTLPDRDKGGPMKYEAQVTYKEIDFNVENPQKSHSQIVIPVRDNPKQAEHSSPIASFVNNVCKVLFPQRTRLIETDSTIHVGHEATVQVSPATKEPVQVLPATKEPVQVLPATKEPVQVLPATKEPVQVLPATKEPELKVVQPAGKSPENPERKTQQIEAPKPASNAASASDENASARSTEFLYFANSSNDPDTSKAIAEAQKKTIDDFIQLNAYALNTPQNDIEKEIEKMKESTVQYYINLIRSPSFNLKATRHQLLAETSVINSAQEKIAAMQLTDSESRKSVDTRKPTVGKFAQDTATTDETIKRPSNVILLKNLIEETADKKVQLVRDIAALLDRSRQRGQTAEKVDPVSEIAKMKELLIGAIEYIKKSETSNPEETSRKDTTGRKKNVNVKGTAGGKKTDDTNEIDTERFILKDAVNQNAAIMDNAIKEIATMRTEIIKEIGAVTDKVIQNSKLAEGPIMNVAKKLETLIRDTAYVHEKALENAIPPEKPINEIAIMKAELIKEIGAVTDKIIQNSKLVEAPIKDVANKLEKLINETAIVQEKGVDNTTLGGKPVKEMATMKEELIKEIKGVTDKAIESNKLAEKPIKGIVNKLEELIKETAVVKVRTAENTALAEKPLKEMATMKAELIKEIGALTDKVIQSSKVAEAPIRDVANKLEKLIKDVAVAQEKAAENSTTLAEKPIKEMATIKAELIKEIKAITDKAIQSNKLAEEPIKNMANKLEELIKETAVVNVRTAENTALAEKPLKEMATMKAELIKEIGALTDKVIQSSKVAEAPIRDVANKLEKLIKDVAVAQEKAAENSTTLAEKPIKEMATIKAELIKEIKAITDKAIQSNKLAEEPIKNMANKLEELIKETAVVKLKTTENTVLAEKPIKEMATMKEQLIKEIGALTDKVIQNSKVAEAPIRDVANKLEKLIKGAAVVEEKGVACATLGEKPTKEIATMRTELINEIKAVADKAIQSNKLAEEPIKSIANKLEELIKETAVVKLKTTENTVLAEKPIKEMATMKEQLIKEIGALTDKVVQNSKLAEVPIRDVANKLEKLIKDAAVVQEKGVACTTLGEKPTKEIATMRAELINEIKAVTDKAIQSNKLAEEPIQNMANKLEELIKETAVVKLKTTENTVLAEKPIKEMATMKAELIKEIGALTDKVIESSKVAEAPIRDVANKLEKLIKDVAVAQEKAAENSTTLAEKPIKEMATIKAELIKEIKAITDKAIQSNKVAEEPIKKMANKLEELIKETAVVKVKTVENTALAEKPIKEIVTMKAELIREIGALTNKVIENSKVAEAPIRDVANKLEKLIKDAAFVKEKTAENTTTLAGKPIKEIATMKAELINEIKAVTDKAIQSNKLAEEPIKNIAKKLEELIKQTAVVRVKTAEISALAEKPLKEIATMKAELIKEIGALTNKVIQNSKSAETPIMDVANKLEKLIRESAIVKEKCVENTALSGNPIHEVATMKAELIKEIGAVTDKVIQNSKLAEAPIKDIANKLEKLTRETAVVKEKAVENTALAEKPIKEITVMKKELMKEIAAVNDRVAQNAALTESPIRDLSTKVEKLVKETAANKDRISQSNAEKSLGFKDIAAMNQKMLKEIATIKGNTASWPINEIETKINQLAKDTASIKASNSSPHVDATQEQIATMKRELMNEILDIKGRSKDYCKWAISRPMQEIAAMRSTLMNELAEIKHATIQRREQITDRSAKDAALIEEKLMKEFSAVKNQAEQFTVIADKTIKQLATMKEDLLKEIVATQEKRAPETGSLKYDPDKVALFKQKTNQLSEMAENPIHEIETTQKELMREIAAIRDMIYQYVLTTASPTKNKAALKEEIKREIAAITDMTERPINEIRAMKTELAKEIAAIRQEAAENQGPMKEIAAMKSQLMNEIRQEVAQNQGPMKEIAAMKSELMKEIAELKNQATQTALIAGIPRIEFATLRWELMKEVGAIRDKTIETAATTEKPLIEIATMKNELLKEIAAVKDAAAQNYAAAEQAQAENRTMNEELKKASSEVKDKTTQHTATENHASAMKQESPKATAEGKYSSVVDTLNIGVVNTKEGLTDQIAVPKDNTQRLPATSEYPLNEIFAMKQEIMNEIGAIKDFSVQTVQLASKPLQDFSTMKAELFKEIEAIKEKACHTDNAAEIPVREIAAMKQELMKEIAAVKDAASQRYVATEQPHTENRTRTDELMKEPAGIKDKTTQHIATEAHASTMKQESPGAIEEGKYSSVVDTLNIGVVNTKEGLTDQIAAPKDNTQRLPATSEYPLNEIFAMKQEIMNEIGAIKDFSVQTAQLASKPLQDFSTMKAELLKEIVALKEKACQADKAVEMPAKEIAAMKQELMKEIAAVKECAKQSGVGTHLPLAEISAINAKLIKDIATVLSQIFQDSAIVDRPIREVEQIKNELIKEISSIKDKALRAANAIPNTMGDITGEESNLKDIVVDKSTTATVTEKKVQEVSPMRSPPSSGTAQAPTDPSSSTERDFALRSASPVSLDTRLYGQVARSDLSNQLINKIPVQESGTTVRTLTDSQPVSDKTQADNTATREITKSDSTGTRALTIEPIHPSTLSLATLVEQVDKKVPLTKPNEELKPPAFLDQSIAIIKSSNLTPVDIASMSHSVKSNQPPEIVVTTQNQSGLNKQQITSDKLSSVVVPRETLREQSPASYIGQSGNMSTAAPSQLTLKIEETRQAGNMSTAAQSQLKIEETRQAGNMSTAVPSQLTLKIEESHLSENMSTAAPSQLKIEETRQPGNMSTAAPSQLTLKIEETRQAGNMSTAVPSQLTLKIEESHLSENMSTAIPPQQSLKVEESRPPENMSTAAPSQQFVKIEETRQSGNMSTAVPPQQSLKIEESRPSENMPTAIPPQQSLKVEESRPSENMSTAVRSQQSVKIEETRQSGNMSTAVPPQQSLKVEESRPSENMPTAIPPQQTLKVEESRPPENMSTAAPSQQSVKIEETRQSGNMSTAVPPQQSLKIEESRPSENMPTAIPPQQSLKVEESRPSENMPTAFPPQQSLKVEESRPPENMSTSVRSQQSVKIEETRQSGNMSTAVAPQLTLKIEESRLSENKSAAVPSQKSVKIEETRSGNMSTVVPSQLSLKIEESRLSENKSAAVPSQVSLKIGGTQTSSVTTQNAQSAKICEQGMTDDPLHRPVFQKDLIQTSQDTGFLPSQSTLALTNLPAMDAGASGLSLTTEQPEAVPVLSKSTQLKEKKQETPSDGRSQAAVVPKEKLQKREETRNEPNPSKGKSSADLPGNTNVPIQSAKITQVKPAIIATQNSQSKSKIQQDKVDDQSQTLTVGKLAQNHIDTGTHLERVVQMPSADLSSAKATAPAQTKESEQFPTKTVDAQKSQLDEQVQSAQSETKPIMCILPRAHSRELRGCSTDLSLGKSVAEGVNEKPRSLSKASDVKTNCLGSGLHISGQIEKYAKAGKSLTIPTTTKISQADQKVELSKAKTESETRSGTNINSKDRTSSALLAVENGFGKPSKISLVTQDAEQDQKTYPEKTDAKIQSRVVSKETNRGSRAASSCRPCSASQSPTKPSKSNEMLWRAASSTRTLKGQSKQDRKVGGKDERFSDQPKNDSETNKEKQGGSGSEGSPATSETMIPDQKAPLNAATSSVRMSDDTPSKPEVTSPIVLTLKGDSSANDQSTPDKTSTPTSKTPLPAQKSPQASSFPYTNIISPRKRKDGDPTSELVNADKSKRPRRFVNRRPPEQLNAGQPAGSTLPVTNKSRTPVQAHASTSASSVILERTKEGRVKKKAPRSPTRPIGSQTSVPSSSNAQEIRRRPSVKTPANSTTTHETLKTPPTSTSVPEPAHKTTNKRKPTTPRVTVKTDAQVAPTSQQTDFTESHERNIKVDPPVRSNITKTNSDNAITNSDNTITNSDNTKTNSYNTKTNSDATKTNSYKPKTNSDNTKSNFDNTKTNSENTKTNFDGKHEYSAATLEPKELFQTGRRESPESVPTSGRSRTESAKKQLADLGAAVDAHVPDLIGFQHELISVLSSIPELRRTEETLIPARKFDQDSQILKTVHQRTDNPVASYQNVTGSSKPTEVKQTIEVTDNFSHAPIDGNTPKRDIYDEAKFPVPDKTSVDQQHSNPPVTETAVAIPQNSSVITINAQKFEAKEALSIFQYLRDRFSSGKEFSKILADTLPGNFLSANPPPVINEAQGLSHPSAQVPVEEGAQRTTNFSLPESPVKKSNLSPTHYSSQFPPENKMKSSTGNQSVSQYLRKIVPNAKELDKATDKILSAAHRSFDKFPIRTSPHTSSEVVSQYVTCRSSPQPFLEEGSESKVAVPSLQRPAANISQCSALFLSHRPPAGTDTRQSLIRQCSPIDISQSSNCSLRPQPPNKTPPQNNVRNWISQNIAKTGSGFSDLSAPAQSSTSQSQSPGIRQQSKPLFQIVQTPTHVPNKKDVQSGTTQSPPGSAPFKESASVQALRNALINLLPGRKEQELRARAETLVNSAKSARKNVRTDLPERSERPETNLAKQYGKALKAAVRKLIPERKEFDHTISKILAAEKKHNQKQKDSNKVSAASKDQTAVGQIDNPPKTTSDSQRTPPRQEPGEQKSFFAISTGTVHQFKSLAGTSADIDQIHNPPKTISDSQRTPPRQEPGEQKGSFAKSTGTVHPSKSSDGTSADVDQIHKPPKKISDSPRQEPDELKSSFAISTGTIHPSKSSDGTSADVDQIHKPPKKTSDSPRQEPDELKSSFAISTGTIHPSKSSDGTSADSKCSSVKIVSESSCNKSAKSFRGSTTSPARSDSFQSSDQTLNMCSKGPDRSSKSKKSSKARSGPPGCPCGVNDGSNGKGSNEGPCEPSQGVDLPGKVKDRLNDQVAAEMGAFLRYFGMMAHFGRTDVAFRGMQAFFRKQMDEESEHAREVARWINSRGADARFDTVGGNCSAAPVHTLEDSHPNALEESLKMEASVSQALYGLHSLSKDCCDVITAKFISKIFLREQTESMEEIGRLLQHARRAEASPRATLTFDEQLYERYKDQSDHPK